VLATNQRGSYVVDPDYVGTIYGDGIAAPNVLRVQVGDVDILDDDVAGAADDAEALALNDSLLPTLMRDLLDLTVIPRRPALSYLTLTMRAFGW
jgi:hypothetical protein